MGYDLYVEHDPAAERLETLREQGKGWDDPEYVQAIDARLDGPGYWRESIWSIGRLREQMRLHGMLVEDVDHAPFPSNDGVPKTPEGYLDDESPEYQAMQAAADLITDAEAEDPPTGIPAYKLGSNDGWLVTRREIEAALAAAGDDVTRYLGEGVGDGVREFGMDFIDALPTGPATKLYLGGADTDIEAEERNWRGFVAFLRHAAANGGFRTW